MNFHPFHDHLAALWPTVCDAAIKSAVVLSVAAITALFLRRASSARRHLVWTLTIGGAMVMPVLSALTPSWRIDVASRDVESPASSSGIEAGSGTLPSLRFLFGKLPMHSDSTSPKVASPAASTTSEPTRLPWTTQSIRGLLVEIWLVGVMAMLLPTILGLIGAWRLGRRATRVVDPTWLQLLETARRQLAMSRSVVLLQSADRTMPMTWGIFRARLLLPCEADHWQMSRRRIALMHELAHIQRRDCLMQLMAQVARAIYWFNPLCWWALRQLTIERELACDDVVLGRGTLASEYAEELLAVASNARRALGLPVAAVAMARPSKLGERLVAILDPTRRRDSVTRFQAAWFVAILSLLLVPMSMIKPFAVQAAEPQSTHPVGNQPISPAAALDLPPLATNTRILIRIESSKCSPQTLKQAADTVLGLGANLVELGNFTRLHDVLVRHRVPICWISADISLGRQAPTDMVTYIRMREDADADAIKADLKKAIAGILDSDCSIQGHFLAIGRPDGDPGSNRPRNPVEAAKPIVADAATGKAFAAAMSLANPNDGFALALVPDAGIKDAIRKMKPDQNDPGKGRMAMELSLLDAVADSQFITASVALGATPSITVKARCENEAAAQSVSASLDAGMTFVTEQVANLRQMYGKENSPETAEKVKTIDQAVDQFKMIKAGVQGTVVELAINSKALQSVGRAVVPLLAVARDDAKSIASMNNVHQLLTGLMQYATDHDGQWPDKLEQLKELLGGDESFKRVMTNPLTGDAEGFIYQKPGGKMSDLKNPGGMPVIWEAKDGRKNDAGAIGYADGHVANVRRMLTVPKASD